MKPQYHTKSERAEYTWADLYQLKIAGLTIICQVRNGRHFLDVAEGWDPMVITALLSGQQGALLIEAVLSRHNHVIIAATLPVLQEYSSNAILFNNSFSPKTQICTQRYGWFFYWYFWLFLESEQYKWYKDNKSGIFCTCPSEWDKTTSIIPGS